MVIFLVSLKDTRKRLNITDTVQECINIHTELLEEIEKAITERNIPRGGFRPYWDIAYDALRKALRKARTKEEADSVLQKAALHKDRKNFEKLWKDAKNKKESLAR